MWAPAVGPCVCRGLGWRRSVNSKTVTSSLKVRTAAWHRNGPPMAELKVDTFHEGDAVVCRVTGDLYIETLPQAARVLNAVADALPRLLCLDLRRARLYGATALGLLLGLARRLPLALIDPTRRCCGSSRPAAATRRCWSSPPSRTPSRPWTG